MTYAPRLTEGARGDLKRLYAFLADHDPAAARRALQASRKGFELLGEFPFSCRKATPGDPFLREMVIPFGGGGYVALYDISQGRVTIVAVRHQREDDYY